MERIVLTIGIVAFLTILVRWRVRKANETVEFLQTCVAEFPRKWEWLRAFFGFE